MNNLFFSYFPTAKNEENFLGWNALNIKNSNCFQFSENSSVFIEENDNFFFLFKGTILPSKEIEKYFQSVDYEFIDFHKNILILFQKLQTQLFSLLNGNWAMMIIDKSLQKIYACCDSLGGQKIFYLNDDKQLKISTNIHQLKTNLSLDSSAVQKYLLWGKYAKISHFYEKIKSLPKGYYLEYDLNTNILQEKKYYKLPYKNCTASFNPYEQQYYIDTLRTKFIENVRFNLSKTLKIAIVDRGNFSDIAMAYTAKKIYPELKTTIFSVDNQRKKNVFADFSCKIVNLFDENWSNNFLNFLQIQTMPMVDFENFCRYQLIQSIKQENFSDYLTGIGGEELLAENHYFFVPFISFLWQQWLWKDLGKELFGGIKNGLTIKSFFKLRKDFYAEEILRKNQKNKILDSEKQLFANILFSENIAENFSSDNWVLNDFLYEYYNNSLLINILSENCFSSYFDLHSLMPFCNYLPFVEYCFSIPSTQKIHNGYLSFLLRQAMIGIVDDNIRFLKNPYNDTKQKQLFWNKCKPIVRQILMDYSAKLSTWINVNQINWNHVEIDKNVFFQDFLLRLAAVALTTS